MDRNGDLQELYLLEKRREKLARISKLISFLITLLLLGLYVFLNTRAEPVSFDTNWLIVALFIIFPVLNGLLYRLFCGLNFGKNEGAQRANFDKFSGSDTARNTDVLGQGAAQDGQIFSADAKGERVLKAEASEGGSYESSDSRESAIYERFEPKVAEDGGGSEKEGAAGSKFNFLADLQSLENERAALQKSVKKAGLIAAVVGTSVGALVARFWGDIIAGVFFGIAVYGAAGSFLTASKRQNFRSNFKNRVVASIAKSFGLSYDESGGLGTDEFFEIYDCYINEQSSEDMMSGEVQGVRVRFSDFYAAEKVRTKNGTRTDVKFHGVLFVADFHKRLNCEVRVCHKNSRNLRKYGQRANMDDVKFEEFFDVYTTDQVGARYALTPLLMQRLTEVYLRLGSQINAVLREDKIYVAIETWRDNFEPRIDCSLKQDATIELYVDEIGALVGIVSELNLNRKIWSE
ncbi:DUF3137 domain-containing protein [uncultured Campylobacter sp.]|uniref:DUF3137 domain-containing protein n=1 Tax=uncultured Campylobacter sp. TaxID=218934 RepID=UPI002622D8E8|nr:DUF3137 domain-containing protein [uncultured Campylobacter sp.]